MIIRVGDPAPPRRTVQGRLSAKFSFEVLFLTPTRTIAKRSSNKEVVDFVEAGVARCGRHADAQLSTDDMFKLHAHVIK
jgi:hypothetical protein